MYRQISWGNLNIANQLLKVFLDYNPARDVPLEKPVPPSFSSNCHGVFLGDFEIWAKQSRRNDLPQENMSTLNRSKLLRALVASVTVVNIALAFEIDDHLCVM